MKFDQETVVLLLRESILRPRQAVRQILTVGEGLGLAFIAVGIMAILSAAISVMLSWFSAPSGQPDMDYLLNRPFILAALQALGMIIFSAVVLGVGRIFKGKGRFAQILLVVAWLDFILLFLQLAMLLLVLAIPVMGGITLIATMCLVTWLLANFIAEVHGFQSTFATLAVLIGVMLLIGMALVQFSPPM